MPNTNKIKPLIEFLIPSYKRFEGTIVAANSIYRQIIESDLINEVRITIVDDASPDVTVDRLAGRLNMNSCDIEIRKNKNNKGMSRNIYDMVSGSCATFCTVLTDDDWLAAGCLSDMVKHLKSIEFDDDIGGIFTPRYSYLENGQLHCVVCKPFASDRLIKPGSLSAIRYCSNGFILTGFIFRPKLFASKNWQDNIDNGYFPVINYAFISSRFSIKFVNRKWFHHTVLNHCHWDAWGASSKEQYRRLYGDYMDAISYIAINLPEIPFFRISRIAFMGYEIKNYLHSMMANKFHLRDFVGLATANTRSRLPFYCSLVLAFVCFGFMKALKPFESRDQV